MNIFITLLENVNKSRTSANNLSLILRLCNYDKSPDHVESAGKITLIALLFCISYYYRERGGNQ
jgi:hypothetical protein